MARILVIDDEELVRLTVRQTLELAGHAVAEATNGRQGVEMFQANPPELVITDMIMPEQEGIETIRRLRHARPGIRIIAMSGGGRTGNMDFLEIAGRLGANRIVHKPFDPDELAAAVQEVLATPEPSA